MSEVTEFHKLWHDLYRLQLPAQAKARDPVQKKWPVYLDHCFARIVLDNAVGVDRPWTEVVKSPAVKNMTEEQFEAAIELAEKIATGESNLDELNERSLELRGKKKKKRKGAEIDDNSGEEGDAKKAKKATGTISSYFLASPKSGRHVAGSQGGVKNKSMPLDHAISEGRSPDIDMSLQLKRIADSDITTFRKQMLTLLCQIPRGRYSTYQAMSDYISKTSHQTCARAVGSAMRNNPFAPEVPCHRVLANDGTLGGFGGHWGEGGKFASKKHELLYEEGVRFDSRGKVKGPPFREFWG